MREKDTLPRIVDPLREERWDQWVGAHDRASVFHSALWARVLREAYGYRPVYLVGGRAVPDVLPLMEISSPVTGRRGVCLPFSDFCEPLVETQEGFRRLWDGALAMARQRGWRYLELRGGEKFLHDAPFWTRYLGHELELSGGAPRLFKALRDSTRRNINKARKQGVEPLFSTSENALKVFYRLHCRTRKEHGLPPQPFSFFAKIRKHLLLKGLGRIVLGLYHGRPVAALIFFCFRKRVIYKYGASDRNFQHLRPNNLVMWEGIARFAEAGFSSLSLGRTDWGQEGLRQFKRGWGAQERTLFYYRYDLGEERFLAGPVKGPGRVEGLLRRFPLPLLRVAGALLYRHMG